MFQKLKENATLAKTAAGALVLSAITAPAMAQATDPGAEIVTKVESTLTSGVAIATAVVLGLFAIWGVKLLWRSK